LNVPALSAGTKPSGAAELTRFAAVAATVDTAALTAQLARRRQALAERPGDVYDRADEVAQVYARWFATYDIICPLPGQIAAARRKGLPAIGPAVDALLYGELTTGVLMGVQDAEAVDGGLHFDWAAQGETFTGFRSTVTCSQDEPVVRDATGIVASVPQGPDRRTSVTKSSRHLVFTVYDAPGLDIRDFDTGVRVLTDLLRETGSVPDVQEVVL
jgi:DNA/RNA-binding domain of Phe-tRNA-synthetase-like protein